MFSDLFQSLVGFKINWNLDIKSILLMLWKFQSLVGFKINWNVLEYTAKCEDAKVSIPSRV